MSFKEYLLKKHKEWVNKNESDDITDIIETDKLICMLVNDFMIRPYNLDMFMLRQVVSICPHIVKENATMNHFTDWLQTKNYVNISYKNIHKTDFYYNLILVY